MGGLAPSGVRGLGRRRRLDLGQLLRGAGRQLLRLLRLVGSGVATAMRQGQLEGLQHVGQLDQCRATKRADRSSGARHHQVRPVARHGTVQAEPGNQRPDRTRELHQIEARRRRLQPVVKLQLAWRRGPVHRLRVVEEFPLELHNAKPLIDVGRGRHLDAEPKPVEQLGAELTFLRIHGADQDEVGWVRNRHSLAFDDVDPHRRRVQEDVDEVVVEQIDLVDI